MTSAGTARSSSSLPEALEQTIHWLLDNADEIAADMVRSSFAAVPELTDRLDELFEDHRAASAASIARQARMMLRGEKAEALTLMPQTLDYLRDIARRGVSLDQIIRSTRYGMAHVWERVATRLVETAGPESGPLIVLWGRHHLHYANLLADAAIREYGDERERWTRSADALRADTVRALLGGASIDVGVASQRLSYELRRSQLALVAWARPDADGDGTLKRLEATIAAAASALGPARPLVIAQGISTLWAWVSPADGRDEEAITADLLETGVNLALGRCGYGADGFRASHAEALEARRFAQRTGRGGLVCYRHVELASLMTSDPERALGFVAEQLGELAADDRAMEPLRETLLTYLESGMNKLLAASRLGVHQHTVANRLRRTEELLARPVDSGRTLELHAALVLRRELGAVRAP